MTDRYQVRIKRVYDQPEPEDGYRVLVERLWPRGMKKEQLALNDWLKQVAPSTELRKWFSHNPARWVQFCELYQQELRDTQHAQALSELSQQLLRGPVTLLYSASDEQHNSALVLRQMLERSPVSRAA